MQHYARKGCCTLNIAVCITWGIAVCITWGIAVCITWDIAVCITWGIAVHMEETLYTIYCTAMLYNSTFYTVHVMSNNGSVKIKYFFCRTQLSRKMPIACKNMFIDSSTIAKTFGIIVCARFIVDTNLYAFKVTRFYVSQSRSVAEDTLFFGI